MSNRLYAKFESFSESLSTHNIDCPYGSKTKSFYNVERMKNGDTKYRYLISKYVFYPTL